MKNKISGNAKKTTVTTITTSRVFGAFGALMKGARLRKALARQTASSAPTFIVFLSALAYAAPPPTTPDKSVLVLNLRSIGVDENIIPTLVSDIAQSISNQPGYKASTIVSVRPRALLKSSERFL